MTPRVDESSAPRSLNVWRMALVAVAVAGALGGCSSTSTGTSSGAARSSDPASQQPQQGANGVTVFGDIDVNVTRERTR